MQGLKLCGINKSFGSAHVLKNVDLEIADKEFVVFVGPSGCGKTTLLRILAGLETADTGHVEIDGADVTHEHPIKRGVAMVFQSYALYPHLSVFENIAFPLRVAKAPEDEVKRKVNDAAAVLQLTDHLGHKPGQLSGGQRQRVAIGRSIVRKPRVFLFDEPLSNLDAALRTEMRVELATLRQQLETTMIYVTHDQVEAMTLADRIVVMSEGVVVQYGTPLELYHLPVNRFVAGFIGHPAMNFLDAKCVAAGDDGVTASIDGVGELLLPVDPGSVQAGAPLQIGLRPDDLDEAGSDGPAVEIDIQVLEHLGGSSLAYGSLAGSTARICGMLAGNTAIRPGQKIKLGVKPDCCHVFTAAGAALRRRRTPLDDAGDAGPLRQAADGSG